MQVRIEDIGPCKKVLHFEVPADRVRSKLDESYLELGQSIELPGFRKGHVPRKLMEKRFGEEVSKDVRASLISESLEKALDENALKVVGMPDIPQAEGALNVDAALNFDVTVEVRPKIEIPDYSKFELVRPSEELSEQDVATAIERLRRRRGTYVPVAEGDVQEDDLVVADLAILVDGNAIDRVEDANVRVALRSLAGIACAELPSVLCGAKASETRTANVKLPADYRHADHRGKQAQVTIAIKEIKRLELPEVTEDWARTLRFDSLEDLKTAIRATLRDEKREMAAADLERQLADVLVQAANFDLPEGPVQRLSESYQRRHRLMLQMRNLPEDQIEMELAKSRDQAKDDAVRECKLFFVLEAIADDRRVFATEDEVRQRVAMIASNYGRSFENVRAEMERDGSLDDLRAQMRRDKTIEYILSRVQIKGQTPPPPPPAGDAPNAGAPAS